MRQLRDAKIALVHDHLLQVRGGEKVFKAFTEVFPEADLYSLAFDPLGMGQIGEQLQERGLRTSIVQRLPNPGRRFRAYFPVYPLAARLLDFDHYDLVISSSSGFTHFVRPREDACHVSYCYTPLRYAWSERDATAAKLPPLLRPVYRLLAQAFRALDRRAAKRVDFFATSSEFVRQRLRSCYGRDAAVINPSVEVDRFHPSATQEDYFLCVSALVPYKRIDIAVEAFTRLGLPLRVVGSGPEEQKLRRVSGPSVEFLGQASDDVVARLYERCRAFVFPTEEDFGITCLEAQAAGRPVVAFGGGGALETVVDGVTGRFFFEQTADALAQIVATTDFESFDPRTIRAHVEKFGVSVFKQRIIEFVDRCYEQHTFGIEEETAWHK